MQLEGEAWDGAMKTSSVVPLNIGVEDSVL